MAERRKAWQIASTLQVLNTALVLVAVFTVVSFVILIKTISGFQHTPKWMFDFVLVQLIFSAGVILIFLLTILVLIHRGLGPLKRIDKIIDEVLAGNYSLRITVRQKDFIYPFAAKINKLIELLQNKAKS